VDSGSCQSGLRSNEEKPSKRVLRGKGKVIDRVVLSGTLLQLSKVHNEAAWRVVGKLKDLVARFFNLKLYVDIRVLEELAAKTIKDEISSSLYATLEYFLDYNIIVA
jgi:hypothetical protein